MQDIDFMLLASMYNPRELRIVDDAKHPTMKKIIDKEGDVQGNVVYTTRKAAEYQLFDLVARDHKEEVSQLLREKDDLEETSTESVDKASFLESDE